MSTFFQFIKVIVGQMEGVKINKEIPEEEILVISDEDSGIKDMVIDCEDNMIILTQSMMAVPTDAAALRKLMQMSDEMSNGSMVIDVSGSKVLWKDKIFLPILSDEDTILQPINGFRLFIAEYLDDLIALNGSVQ